MAMNLVRDNGVNIVLDRNPHLTVIEIKCPILGQGNAMIAIDRDRLITILVDTRLVGRIHHHEIPLIVTRRPSGPPRATSIITDAKDNSLQAEITAIGTIRGHRCNKAAMMTRSDSGDWKQCAPMRIR